jgi:hypothetical protein
LEFLAKIYWANFFPWAKKAKKGTCTKNRTGPAPEAGWAGRPSLTGLGGSRRRLVPVFARIAPFNKENEVLSVFLFGLFIWPNWELGNQSHQAIFCTHIAAIVSPRSLELKQGAKEPSMDEVKRCELKLPIEMKRTACIRCGGRVPTKAIASRNPVE